MAASYSVTEQQIILFMTQALRKSGWEGIKVSALHNVLDGMSLTGYKYERENTKKKKITSKTSRTCLCAFHFLYIYRLRTCMSCTMTKRQQHEHVNKTRNSRVSCCSAGLKDDAAGSSSVGFCAQTHYGVYNNTHPRVKSRHCLRFRTQDAKVKP